MKMNRYIISMVEQINKYTQSYRSTCGESDLRAELVEGVIWTVTEGRGGRFFPSEEVEFPGEAIEAALNADGNWKF